MDFLNKLLDYYSLTLEEYKSLLKAPSFDSLPNIKNEEEVKKAISLLSKVGSENGKILVYGDYDCDGIIATSILVSSFRSFGLHAEGYIPSRYKDGYGITKDNVDKIAKAGYSLIFTADNGIAATEALGEAENKKIPVIVLDHHEYDSLPLYPSAIIHPDTIGLKDYPPSAGLLSYYFARSLLGDDDKRLLSLASLTIISDSMDLKGYNKEALKLGIALMNEDLPMEISLLSDKKKIDENVLGMEVIPKINAVGRIKEGYEGNKVLKFFTTESLPEKNELAAFVIQTNDERKALTKDAESSLNIDLSKEAIVVLAPLKEGMNGLLASRLLSEYEKPVAVFSPSSKDPSVYVGSMRSKEGFNILKALEATNAPLLAGGGHEFAGGCSIKAADLDTFTKDFLFCALKHKLVKETKRSLPLSINEATMANFKILRSFGPFGKGSEAPNFLITLKAEDLTYSRDGRFLSMNLSSEARLFSFKLGPTSFPKKGEVKMLVSFQRNEWKGKERLDLLASSLEG